MDEHIKREAAIRVICDCCAVCADIECCDYAKGSYGGCKEIEGIRAIPAADVKLVVRGKWKDAVQGAHDSPHVRCSICGEYFWRYFRDFDFCPNCGADMREGE